MSASHSKRQQHRSAIQVHAVFDHYKINIAIPFLDHVMSDLDGQFSRKFVKRNFRHISWISINSLTIVISMFIIATSIFTVLSVTAASLLGFVPSVVRLQQVDLTEVVGLYEHDLPSPECVHHELLRWQQWYVLRCIYGIYKHFTIQILTH